MTNNITQKINRLLSDGYQFNFGDYISNGFNVLNKNIGGFIGFTLIFFIITMTASSIPIVGTIGQMLISYPLTAGFYIVANRVYKKYNFEFGHFFDGFQLFKPLLILMVFMTVISLIASLPMFFVVGPDLIQLATGAIDDPDAILSMFQNINYGLFILAALPSIYVSIAYAWSPFFVIFHDMPAWEAMEASRKLITKKWFAFFGFTIIVALIGIAGVFAFFVGLIYTIPFIYCAVYVAFEDIVGIDLEEESQDDDLFEHLVD